MQCQVCAGQQPKYKCPSCPARYCSVQCCKEHRSNGCEKERRKGEKGEGKREMEGEELIKTDYIEDESLRLTAKQLEGMRASREIREMLEDEGLRAELADIDNSKLRLNRLQEAMGGRKFMEWADQVLGVLAQNGDI